MGKGEHMEIDCHYYGTFHMACLAGFSTSEAKEIAWAAQTVDELSCEKVKKLRDEAVEKQLNRSITGNTTTEEYLRQKKELIIKLTKEIYNVFTFQTNEQLFLLSSVGENETHRDLKMIRGVWVPFHFLPAGMTEATALYNKVVYYNSDDESHLYQRWRVWNDEKYKIRNRNDTMLICRHSTELSKKMISRVTKLYQDYIKNNDKLKALYAVGICMHVLADTWSHQGFTGSCNQVINQGNLYDAKMGAGRVVVGGLAVALSNVYSSTWTGHGSVDTNPDIPGNTYTYIPNYVQKMVDEGKVFDQKDETTKYILTELTNVNNLERFTNAFYQMYEALYSIKNGVNVPEGFGKEKINNELTAIQKHLFTDEKNTDKRCEKWVLFLAGRYTTNSVSEYKLSSGKIESFLEMARGHRNYIMEEVSKTLLNANNYMNDIDNMYINILQEEALAEIEGRALSLSVPPIGYGPKY